MVVGFIGMGLIIVMTLNELILEIQNQFKYSCPNGILLEWDKNRFYDSFVTLFAGYKVINQTDFNYSYCNSFDIEISSKQNIKITIKISFIVNAYTVYLTKRRKPIPNSSITDASFYIKKIRQFMNEKGFQEISDEFDIIVHGVQLELSEIVTVGRCLFDDF